MSEPLPNFDSAEMQRMRDSTGLMASQSAELDRAQRELRQALVEIQTLKTQLEATPEPEPESEVGHQRFGAQLFQLTAGGIQYVVELTVKQ